MNCRHLNKAEEAFRLDAAGRETPITVYLCAWADNEPAVLVNAPRWMQRNSLSGHLLKYPDDCIGCPAYSALTRQSEGG